MVLVDTLEANGLWHHKKILRKKVYKTETYFLLESSPDVMWFMDKNWSLKTLPLSWYYVMVKPLGAGRVNVLFMFFINVSISDSLWWCMYCEDVSSILNVLSAGDKGVIVSVVISLHGIGCCGQNGTPAVLWIAMIILWSTNYIWNLVTFTLF